MKRLHFLPNGYFTGKENYCTKCKCLLLLREESDGVLLTGNLELWVSSENNCERIQPDSGKIIRLSTAGKY